jgi:hypothetical protein
MQFPHDSAQLLETGEVFSATTMRVQSNDIIATYLVLVT